MKIEDSRPPETLAPVQPGKNRSGNHSRAILQALVSFLIVLVMVAALEVLSHSSGSGNPGDLPVILQTAASPTAILKSPASATGLPPVLTLSTETPTQPSQMSHTETQASLEEPTQDIQLTPTPDPSASWMSVPIIPDVTSTVRQIYQKGLALGNDPNAFSKIGDCNTLSVRFLTYFDGTPAEDYYNLDAFSYLQPVIDQFNGSFKRESVAVGDGYNTSAILSPFRADPNVCNGGESPLECEYRLHNPSFAIIAIGTDDYLKQDKFESNLRQIIQVTIERGIVPILATKADEANQLDYNPIITRLAQEFDIPLWNLWLAQQPLPAAGLTDNMHPSGEFAAFDFSASNLEKYGWPVRNLTALQALYAVWQGVTQ